MTNAGILSSQFPEHFLSNAKHHIAMKNSADDIENKLKSDQTYDHLQSQEIMGSVS